MRRDTFELVIPASRFCWPCYQGNHSKRHGQIGCLQGIGPREDVICRCEQPGDYKPPRLPMIFSRSRQHQMRHSTG